MAFSRPPYGWPPDVIRRQSIRDLRLILDAQDPGE